MERPTHINLLTQQINEKTHINMLLEITLQSNSISEDKYYRNFFAQIWKDQDGIYTIVYCTIPVSYGKRVKEYGEIRTFDIKETDGIELGALLSKGPFENVSRGIKFNPYTVQIKPYIANPSGSEYTWVCLPTGYGNLKTALDIVYPYVAMDIETHEGEKRE